MPTMGTSLGGNVLKAMPSAEAIAGAMGTMTAEIKRHKEYNDAKTRLLGDLPGEMCDDIELVLIKTDKFTTVPLRASNLTDPKAKFYCELSIAQQTQLADLREKFRKNEHGSDTPIGMWPALNAAEKHQLTSMGVLYVEQLAAYQDHEHYKLGNGGSELVKRAQRHIGSKLPNKQEEFEKTMNSLIAAQSEERKLREDAEARYLELQERLAALETSPAGKTKAPKPGVQPEG